MSCETERNSGQAADDCAGYRRMIYKVCVHVVNAATFHFVREPHGFGKDSDRTDEKIQAAPGVLQDMEEQTKVSSWMAANIVPIGLDDLRRKKWMEVSPLHELPALRVIHSPAGSKQRE
jgi:hypothetical protein